MMLGILGAGARRAGVVLGAALALAAPAVAHAEPGYTTIFDGTATGSDASFDKWAQVGGGDIALQGDGTMRTSGGFGMRWYTVKPFGDWLLARVLTQTKIVEKNIRELG